MCCTPFFKRHIVDWDAQSSGTVGHSHAMLSVAQLEPFHRGIWTTLSSLIRLIIHSFVEYLKICHSCNLTLMVSSHRDEDLA